ncbi:outer membrane lipoprotein-sorting protein [Caldithrix abyssi]|nr:outer membrane lipoprotein-sorting protein [Caldithrix abyssi]
MKCLITILLLITTAFSQTGLKIAWQMDHKKAPADMISRISMVLTNAKGKTRSNTMFSKSMDGGKKQIIWFLSPADDKGVAFLKIEHDDKDDEMRMWLPAFKKVRRISSKRKGDAFMGSDLSYEDMTSRDLSENEYNRLKDETIEGVDCYVLEVLPKSEAKSSYSKHILWIQKSRLVLVKEESFDKNGQLKKEKYFIFNQLKGYDVMAEIFVKDVQKNHTTSVKFEEIRLDTGIDQNLFQEKNLKRLPRM